MESVNVQIWFPKCHFENPNYIENEQIHSLRIPNLNAIDHENNLAAYTGWRTIIWTLTVMYAGDVLREPSGLI